MKDDDFKMLRGFADRQNKQSEIIVYRSKKGSLVLALSDMEEVNL